METTELLRLTNNGNAPGKFKWVHSEKRLFNVIPEEGEVPAASWIDLKVVYRPS